MNFFTRALPVPTLAVLATMVACGSEGSAPTWSDGGTTGNSSGGGNGGGPATNEAGATSSSSGGSPASGSGGGANGGGNTFGSFGDGGTPAGDLTGQQCLGLNSTRSCCTTGTQTCGNAAEFAVWGPCLSATGATVVCGTGDAGCGMNETGKACDAGIDAPPPPPPPPPPPLQPPPAICKDMAISTEPEILVGYSPALGQTVGQTGQIKVWVNDENPPFVAPGEQIDPKTGLITAPGNRLSNALDGLLWEPALYIAPDTPQNGGRPHFPQWVKGWYDNTPPNGSGGHQVPGMDPVPPGARLQEIYTGEDIWDVAALGLAPGKYTAVFVIHDGDDDRAIGCVTIDITP
jgi:hypothetical protein